MFCVKRDDFALTAVGKPRFIPLISDGLKLFLFEMRVKGRASLCIYYGARTLTIRNPGHDRKNQAMSSRIFVLQG